MKLLLCCTEHRFMNHDVMCFKLQRLIEQVRVRGTVKIRRFFKCAQLVRFFNSD